MHVRIGDDLIEFGGITRSNGRDRLTVNNKNFDFHIDVDCGSNEHLSQMVSNFETALIMGCDVINLNINVCFKNGDAWTFETLNKELINKISNQL
jgi:hypothetical protein